jgi:hypothetical protein
VGRKDRQDQSQPAGGNDLVNDAAERLATIVAAAERAAEQVIDDAEAQARQTLADAEADAERIRGQALAAVERARRELGALSAEPEPEPPEPSRVAHLSAVTPIDEPRLDVPPAQAPPLSREASPGEPKRGSAAGARLLATQMAVSGSSREEIEARLRNGFEIEDTTAILDAILGPEE